MSGLPAEFLESPLLVDIRDQITKRLDAEHVRRMEFRATAEDRRVEFINGEVVDKVPNTFAHQSCLSRLEGIFSMFVKVRRLGFVAREQALTAFPRNDYCPDLCFWKNGRGVGNDPKQFVFPPPDFVAEALSPSTERFDRGVKFADYEAHGVAEYWIIDVDQEVIEQYVLRDGRMQRIESSSDEIIQSAVVQGLAFPVKAAFDDQVHLQCMRKILSEWPG
jgi:Uma2 family endonuclease